MNKVKIFEKAPLATDVSVINAYKTWVEAQVNIIVLSVNVIGSSIFITYRDASVK